MKFLLLACLLIIISSLAYKYLFAEDDPVIYKTLLEKQTNFFVVPKDSANDVWQRAKIYLAQNSSLIAGGTLQENDSLLFLPYYNHYHKGNSIRIEKHRVADSVSFLVQWWYSQNFQTNGSKALSLFMRHHVKKSDFK